MSIKTVKSLQTLIQDQTSYCFLPHAQHIDLFYCGTPVHVQPLEFDTRSIEEAVNTHQKGTYRCLVLSYELGAACLQLPRPQHHGAWGYVFDLEHVQLCALEPNDTGYEPLSVEQIKLGLSDEAYHARIKTILQDIQSGLMYQANLSRALFLPNTLPAWHIYERLRHLNPVPQAACLCLPELTLISNSMETLLHYNATTRVAQSFPIKGTCSRTNDLSKNEKLLEQLLQSEKEIAEHMMIVDLVRNDLGRLCVPGTVTCSHLRNVNTYRYVYHTETCVQGVLSQEEHASALITSLFPGGSVIGAPKRKAYERLQHIESMPRGFYTGSLCVIDPNGDISMSILIRTLEARGPYFQLGVGGGVVFDSVAERELQETWDKASIFLHALGTPMQHA